jgi:hypothetical protein
LQRRHSLFAFRANHIGQGKGGHRLLLNEVRQRLPLAIRFLRELLQPIGECDLEII